MTGSALASQKAKKAAAMGYTFANEARMNGSGSSVYKTYGALNATVGQINHIYDRTPSVTAATTPEVKSIVSSEYSCGRHSTVWELNAQAEIAKFQQQLYEGEAIIGAFSGAINSFGRNIIDTFAEISRLVRPSKTYNIDTNSKNWKESLETYTKGLSHNGIYNAYGIADTYYAVGQLLGDVASTVAGYVGLAKAAKGLTSALQKAPDIISKLSGLGRTLLPTGGAPIESAAAVAGTITEAGELSEALALFGDILFNYDAFKNDWNTLKEALDSQNSNYSADGKYTGGRTDEQLQDLANDPAHAGSTRPSDMAKGQHEAEIGLDLEEQGLLNDIVRDPTGNAEFIENGGSGTHWDIKSFNSNFPPKQGGTTLDTAMESIAESLSQGENVVIDTTNMSAELIDQLTQAISAQGLGNQIIWWYP